MLFPIILLVMVNVLCNVVVELLCTIFFTLPEVPRGNSCTVIRLTTAHLKIHDKFVSVVLSEAIRKFQIRMFRICSLRSLHATVLC